MRRTWTWSGSVLAAVIGLVAAFGGRGETEEARRAAWPGYPAQPTEEERRFFERSGEGAPVTLKAKSVTWQLGRPGKAARFDLIVSVPGGREVTFWATQAGTFENGKHQITVKGDPRTGLARTSFRYGVGPGRYQVLASCPDAARYVAFDLVASRDEGRVTRWLDAMEQAIDCVRPDCPTILREDGRLDPNPTRRRRGR